MVAALSVQLQPGQDGKAPNEIQLFPAGPFRASDGRPEDVDAWRMDGDIARALIERFNARKRRLVIDYEHQTLEKAKNGKPAPASGWMVSLMWREGQGVYATVNWTQRAQGYIGAEEYCYISPVFTYDKQGRPLDLLHAALTNDPALDNLDPVQLAVACTFASGIAHGGAQPFPAQSSKESSMKELLKALLALLNLPDGTPEEEVIAKLNEYAAKAQQNADEVASLTAQVQAKDGQVAALTAQVGTPDPAKYVPVAALTSLQAQVATLTQDTRKRDVDELVTAALTANKLPPALKDWATSLGMQDPAQLKTYLDSAPAIAALSGNQSDGLQFDNTGDGKQLSQTEMAVCTRMGLDPTAYLKATRV